MIKISSSFLFLGQCYSLNTAFVDTLNPHKTTLTEVLALLHFTDNNMRRRKIKYTLIAMNIQILLK